MFYGNNFIHIIKPGDNIYQLSKMYNVGVDEILRLNKNLNPYKVQIGTPIIIWNFAEKTERQTEDNIPETQNSINQVEDIPDLSLRSKIILSTLDNAIWTSMLITSVADNLSDANDIRKRLMEVPEHISSNFEPYYGKEFKDKLNETVKTHLEIEEKIINAYKKNDKYQIQKLVNQWYDQAADIANVFTSVNEYYNENEARNILNDYLKYTIQNIEARLEQNFPTEIESYDKMQVKMVEMGKFLADGLEKKINENKA